MLAGSKEDLKSTPMKFLQERNKTSAYFTETIKLYRHEILISLVFMYSSLKGIKRA